MKDSLILKFLYGTVPGRLALRLLTLPEVSKAAGHVLSSRISAWAVPYYIRKHKIDMSDIEVPEGGFASFNAFFTRRRKTGFQAGLCRDKAGERPAAADESSGGPFAAQDKTFCGHPAAADESSGGSFAADKIPCGRLADSDGMPAGTLISPCDGFLTVLPIRGDAVFDIKHTRFSLEDLLKDTRLAARFRDGLALVFRLTPANYHRYCYAADGTVLRHRRISGKLHCVRPIAVRELPVFAQNSREYQVMRTKKFGVMVQMEIGALLVGKICNERLTLKTNHVHAGEEKGCFEFGGSTILLLLEKEAVCVRGKLYGRKNEDGEIPVRAGECIADAR